MTQVNLAVQEIFAQAHDCYERPERWLTSNEAMAIRHSDLEAQLTVDGHELVRELFQAHLCLRHTREERLDSVEGADGEQRQRVEDSDRGLMSVFGPVRVPRLSYGTRGASDLHPADAAHNLILPRYPARCYIPGLVYVAAIRWCTPTPRLT